MPAKRKPGREHWPRGLVMPRDGYFAYTNPKGRTHAIGYATEDEAIKACEELADRFRTAAVFERMDEDDRSAERMRDRCFQWAKSRASASGKSIMDADEFMVLWERSGGRCELTGITFSPRVSGSAERIWPWHPSLDRIDNAKGYEFDNCRLICVAMNMALHEFGEGVFVTLARCFVSSRFGAKSARDPNAS